MSRPEEEEEGLEDRLAWLTVEQTARLRSAARQAATNAYAPYSGMKVGAAVLVDGGEVFFGCNVENASYGLTICAERAAIFTAVAAKGPQLAIRAIAIFCNSDTPCAPCGACRQVIVEFGKNIAITYSCGRDWKSSTSQQLLPDSFRL